MAAPLLLDILWPIFLILGWEHVRIVPGFTRFNSYDLYDFPWSHSLLMSIVWGTVFSAIYFASTRYREGAIVIWLGVVSHWILDWITHVPDMSLCPGGGPRLGLSLWNHVAATMTIEIAMFIAACFVYSRVTTPRDRIGKYAFAAYALLLLALYIADRFSGQAVPVSASVAAHQIFLPSIFSETLILAWPWWFDAHRSAQASA